MTTDVEIRHFHFFCGLGGGARGFNRGQARVGTMQARFRCLGGIDVDPAACLDFKLLTGARATCLDLFDREQYIAFHGHEPPPGWREVTPVDIRRAAGHERPHIVFLSAPCKGFSGLLSETRSKDAKYQALNRLTYRGVFLMMEAWSDDPPELVIFENVPRIASRGRKLLDKISDLLERYGYSVAETTHDCGELGGLAQSRKRFLLVARHAAKLPAFLYQPPKRSLLAVGDVLGRLPMPGDPAGGPMHGIPRLQWKTWVRLAFVEAGSDWRSLNKLRVVDGRLADYLIIPEHYQDVLGVMRWDETSGAISGRGGATNGRYSVADPRQEVYSQGYGVTNWKEPAGTVAGESLPSNGKFALADPRFDGHEFGQYGVRKWDESTGVVTSQRSPGQGSFSVADPRPTGPLFGKYAVVPWQEPSGAIQANGKYDNGKWSVADPRLNQLPEAAQKLVCVIRSLDNTWHRPFTTLELAALQSLIVPDDIFDLNGASDSSKRERIGNAVPPGAAEAIASVMAQTLLLAWSGETFQLSAVPVWVKPIAVALSVKQPEIQEAL